MQGHGAGDEVRYWTRAWEMEGAWDYGTRVWDKGMVQGMSQGHGARAWEMEGAWDYGTRVWDKGMVQGMSQGHEARV